MVLDEASRRASDRLVIGRLMVRPRLRGRRAPPWTRSRLAGGRLRNQGRWPGCGPGDGKDRAVGRPFPPILVEASAPGLEPRALTQQSVSEWRSIVEVAAFGLPLLGLAAVAGATLGGPFDLGGGPLEAGPDLVGLDLGDRPLVTLGGFPAALAQPAGDHDPVTLCEGVGQVLGLPAPHVDLEEAGVAVAPLAVLLDPLGHRDPQVGHGDAVLGEADLG